MAEDIETCCNKCHHDFPLYESMPDPETNTGDYCLDCFTDLEYIYDEKRGRKWLRDQLPSMEEFMKGYKRIAKGKSSNPRSLENNCHAAAITLIELLKGKVEVEIQRGHWLGNDARKGNTRTAQQHSWVKARVPDNNIGFIIDPTQWVFNGQSPTICLSTEDDDRYDLGGYRMKEAILGEKVIPERKGKLKPSHLDKNVRAWLNGKSPRDWTKWTDEEAFVIANINPKRMGGYATKIFEALEKCGYRAFIPCDARMLVK
jgi:hypothetical protein